MDYHSRLSVVFKYALVVFGDKEKAEKWLSTKIRVLGGKRPMDLLDTDDGLQTVYDVLNKIEFGIYS